jgi:hypothetical protein
VVGDLPAALSGALSTQDEPVSWGSDVVGGGGRGSAARKDDTTFRKTYHISDISISFSRTVLIPSFTYPTFFPRRFVLGGGCQNLFR